MSRFEDAPAAVLDLVDQVKGKYFPELVNAKIKVIFDTAKRKSQGNFVLGRIQRTSSVVRHLTRDEARSADGFDYILYLDYRIWNAIPQPDQIRIVRHELRHCFFDTEAKSNHYKLVGHDIEDFIMEIDLNKEDSRWRERVAAVAASLYDED